MHTTPISLLPNHSTTSTERRESHGAAFANHLREDAPEKTRYDEPRSQKRDEHRRAESNSRAPEKNDESLSSNDHSVSVERSTGAEDVAKRDKDSELPDPVNAASNSVDPLEPLEDASQSFVAEVIAASASTADPADSAAIAGTPQQNPSQVNTSAILTPELVPEGSTAVPAEGESSLGTSPEALHSQTEAALSGTASQNANSPSSEQITETLSLATTSLSPGLPLPTEGSEPNTGTASTIATALGLRVGNNGSNQKGIDSASATGPIEGLTQAGEPSDEADLNLGSTNRTNGATAELAANQQPSAATANAGATNQPAPHDLTSTKEISAIPDTTIRSNDVPAQTNPTGANQTSATASTFGSELKLAGDTSLAAETAAARNTPNTAASQVAVQINRAVQNGQDKFVVNLKPGNLGKISVQLEIGHDNRVIAVIAAERPETLELLQRDSRALELALKEAGLKADSDSLNFSLQSNGDEESPFDDPSGSNHTIAVTQDDDDLDTVPTQNTHAYVADASGVDIHV